MEEDASSPSENGDKTVHKASLHYTVLLYYTVEGQEGEMHGCQ